MFKSLATRFKLTGAVLASCIIMTQSAQAALIVTDQNKFISASEGADRSVSIDVNNDGLFDVKFEIQASEAFGPFAASENGIVTALGTEFYDEQNELNSYSTELLFSSLDGESLRRYDLGESIQSSDFDEYGSNSAFIYTLDQDNTSLWLQNIGDTGFLGYQFSVFDIFDNPPQVFYGFIQVTRGSIRVGDLGFQTTAGANAVVSVQTPPNVAVSAPATLAMVVLAMFGFAFNRTRRL